MGADRLTVLICDDDRVHTRTLAADLERLGYAVLTVRTYREAFDFACTYDVDALVVAPFLRDGSALVLPTALGIRRPLACVLVTRMTERVSSSIVRRVGFDAQLTKLARAADVDRVLQLAAQKQDPLKQDQRTQDQKKQAGRPQRQKSVRTSTSS